MILLSAGGCNIMGVVNSKTENRGVGLMLQRRLGVDDDAATAIPGSCLFVQASLGSYKTK